MKASDIWAIVGCEESQAITIELRKLGVNAFSCDLKHCSGGHPEWHIQGDVFEAINSRIWHLGIFHPTCTYLTVTANKWLKDQPARKSGALVGEERRQARQEAIDFFMRFTEVDIEHWAIENPVGCMSSVWRKPDQIIQPMMFGHVTPKKTCLWTANLPQLKATHHGIVGEYTTSKSGKRFPTWYHYADKSKGNEERSEIRSKTFKGVAEQIAKQYAEHILNPPPKTTLF